MGAEKLGNINVALISIVVGALGTILSDLERRLEELEIRGGIETLHTIAGFRSTIIQKIINLRRLVVTQASVKNYNMKLM